MIQNVLNLVIHFFKTQKLKSLKIISSFILLTLIIAFYLFPFNDLSDYATSQIYKLTNKSVYAQFEDLEISLFPFPALQASNVQVDTKTLPQLKASHITIRPSLISLLKNKPSIDKLVLEDFLKSNLTLRMSETDFTENGAIKSKLNLNMKNLDLSQLYKMVKYKQGPKPKGSLDAEIKAELAFDFSENPDGDFAISSQKNFSLSNFDIVTDLGPVPIPSTNYSSFSLKGTIADQIINISELNLGQPKDPLYIRIKGESGLEIKKFGQKIKPNIRNYKFKIDIQLTKELEKELYFLETFMSEYKSTPPSKNKSRYLFKLNGKNTYSIPQRQKLSSF